MLPMTGDIKFSRLNFDSTCTYMKKGYAPNTDSRKYLTEPRTYCNKIKPFVSYYSKLIHSYNKTAHNILQKEIRLLLPQVSSQKHGIITTLVSGFIGLAYEGILSFLQCRHIEKPTQHEVSLLRILYTDALGIQQYATNSLLFL